MNRKIKLSLLGMLTVVGLFAGIMPSNAYAESAVPTCNGATLHGTVIDVNGAQMDAWFEWGRTSPVSATPVQHGFTSTQSYSATLSSLADNTEYAWRAMARDINTQKVYTGQTLYFTTFECSQPQAQAQSTTPPTLTLLVNGSHSPAAINSGGIANVTWNATPLTASCMAYGGPSSWPGSKVTQNGYFSTTLTQSTTFSMTCTDQATGLSASDSVFINVINNTPPPPTCTDSRATNYGGSLPCNIPPPPVQNCTDSRAYNYGYPLPCQLPPTPPPVQICLDVRATNFGYPMSCNIPPQTCQDQNADNPGSVGACTYLLCHSPSALNYRGPLPCNFGGGTTTTTSTTAQPINITNNNVNTNNNNNVNNGGGGVGGSTNNQIYCQDSRADNPGGTGSCTYNTKCQDVGAINYHDPLPCRYSGSGGGGGNPASVTISADRTSINSGESTTIRWYPSNANYCYGSGGSNGWATTRSAYSDSFNTGALYSTTTYSISCNSNNGGNSGSNSVTVYVNNNGGGGNTNLAPTAVTNTATSLSDGNAQINSLIFPNGSNTNAWFQWGSSTSLGNNTPMKAMGSGTSVPNLEVLTALSPGVTYYYRAVAQNPYGTSYGNTLSFIAVNAGSSTNTNNTVTTVVRNVTTNVTGQASPLVLLSIDGGGDRISPGETRSYHVTWKNISSQTLTRVVLRIVLPEEIVFNSATRGSFSNFNNTLFVDVGALVPTESGELSFSATVKQTLTQQNQLLVVVANIDYVDARNVSGDAIAYATHHVDLSGSNLGANVFGAGFLPNSFLGWLILLILLLILLALSNHLYRQISGPRVATTTISTH